MGRPVGARRLDRGAGAGQFRRTLARLIRALAERRPWSEPLHDIPFRAAGRRVPGALRRTAHRCRVQCRCLESTYIHELTGENPVLNWITGTALTPVRDRLTEERWQRFRAELAPMLDTAYPVRPDGARSSRSGGSSWSPGSADADRPVAQSPSPASATAVPGLLHQPVDQQRVQRPVALRGVGEPHDVQLRPLDRSRTRRSTSSSRPRTCRSVPA